MDYYMKTEQCLSQVISMHMLICANGDETE